MITIIVLALVGGIVAGLIAGLGAAALQKPGNKSAPKPQPHRRETYGHPFSTFDAVKSRLPQAPNGYVWEQIVKTDDRGDKYQVLRLLRMSDHEVTASKSVNLTRFKPYGYRWRNFSEYYARFAGGSWNGDKCREHVVMPIVAWAHGIVSAHEGGTINEHEVIA